MTARDITRTGREAQGGGAPAGESFLVSPLGGSFSMTARRGGTCGPSGRPVSCLRKSPPPFGLAEFLNHRDAWRSRGGRGRAARLGGSRSPAESGLGVTAWSLGNLRMDIVRRHGDTCAPVRAARLQLRVPNWVKWGRGREEVEARERQKRCLSVPCSVEAVPRGAGGHRTADSWRSGVHSPPRPRGRVPSNPQCPRTPRRPGPRAALGPHRAAEKPNRNPAGPRGWSAGARRQRAPGAPFVFRSLTSGKGQGTVNQRGRERTGSG